MRVKVRIEVFRRVVPEVHVDLVAVDLVADAAAPAVEVILPLGHSRDGSALLHALRMSKRPDRRQAGRIASQAGANDCLDPELTLTVPDESDQGPRFPRGRQRAGNGQAPEEGSEIGRLGFPSASESDQKCIEAGVHRDSRLGRTPCGEVCGYSSTLSGSGTREEERLLRSDGSRKLGVSSSR